MKDRYRLIINEWGNKRYLKNNRPHNESGPSVILMYDYMDTSPERIYCLNGSFVPKYIIDALNEIQI